MPPRDGRKPASCITAGAPTTLTSSSVCAGWPRASCADARRKRSSAPAPAATGPYTAYRYGTTAYEGDRNDNNIARGSLAITYREPDLQIDSVSVSNPNPSSGEGLTATWTVTNRGTRDTRVNSWSDGLYLSRDASLDYGDYPLQISAVSLTQNGQPKYLKPGESYTWSASFNLPESISGDFHLIVKADTAIYRNPWNNEPSTIREGLAALARLGPEAGTVNEFQGEGNNVASIALPITLATPPDLQVATVTAPDAVVAGQNFTVGYRVTNAGGDTPSTRRAGTTWSTYRKTASSMSIRIATSAICSTAAVLPAAAATTPA